MSFYLNDLVEFLKQRLPKYLADPSVRRRLALVSIAWLSLSLLSRRLRRPKQQQLVSPGGDAGALADKAAKEPIWVAFSDFLQAVDKGEVAKVNFADGTLFVVFH